MPISNSQRDEHVIDRFWSKVRIAGENDCWLWIASKNQDGYGRFRWKKIKRQAHHVAFFLAKGSWPSYLLHSCDTPACVNPRHLSEGTHRQNIQEAATKGRFFGGAACYQAEVPRVRDLIACGCTNAEIANWLAIDASIISRIRHGKVYARLAA